MSQTIGSFVSVPAACWKYAQYWLIGSMVLWHRAAQQYLSQEKMMLLIGAWYSIFIRYEWAIALSASIAILTYFKFPLIAQVIAFKSFICIAATPEYIAAVLV